MELDRTQDVSSDEPFFDYGWELILRGPDGEHRMPFCRRLLQLSPTSTGGPDLRLEVRDGLAYFHSQPSIETGGEMVSWGQFKPGQTLRWGQGQQLLFSDGKWRATLHCFSEPFLNQSWVLEEGDSLLGRPGRRQNSVALDHPTVSRTHARLRCADGKAYLRCETSSSRTRLDGRDVPIETQVELQDGALIELGDLLFRLHLVPSQGKPDSGLRFASLGGFQVYQGGELVTEKCWRTQNIRWLLARLALDWGRPLSVDVLLDLFWPESLPEKSRNSLNFSLSGLRAILGTDLIIRNAQSIQLNHDRLERHDVVELQENLSLAREFRQAGRTEELIQVVRKAQVIYVGPYLDGCYLDWAIELREKLEKQLLETGRSLLQDLRGPDRLETGIECAQANLALDSCCQLSTAHLMACHIERGTPHQALQIYDSCVKSLKRELGGAEPSIEVLREYYRAQSLV